MSPPSQTIVEVAAGVLLRTSVTGEIEFLLACRPEGKVYAGYWEFPGGKVEQGESIFQALTRELQEEMGITITEASPWLHKEFVYPHATVHLHFWRVTAWEGEIGVTAPLEHSAFDWLTLSHAQLAEHHLSPILPANGPILKGLALPTQMWITEEITADIEIIKLREALAHRRSILSPRPTTLPLIQIRAPQLPLEAKEHFAEAILSAISPLEAPCVLNIAQIEDWQIAERLSKTKRLQGVHLTGRMLANCPEKPNFGWVGASCHDAQSLQTAEHLNFDYALLSPVQPTRSHPEAPPLGWTGFAQLITDNRIPVFALGGLKPEDLYTAQRHGAHGIALMRGWATTSKE